MCKYEFKITYERTYEFGSSYDHQCKFWNTHKHAYKFGSTYNYTYEFRSTYKRSYGRFLPRAPTSIYFSVVQYSGGNSFVHKKAVVGAAQ